VEAGRNYGRMDARPTGTPVLLSSAFRLWWMSISKRACPAWIAPDSGSLQGIRSHHAGFTLRTSSGAVPLVIYFLRVLSPPSPQIKPLPFRNGNCTPNRKLSQVYVLSMKWPKRAGIRRRDRKLSIISDLEPRIRELIRLIAAEVDPGKRKIAGGRVGATLELDVAG
jgi:hypothetical protein